ncbi:MAG: hypothetical protein AAB737_02250 [Patescibacteria group bacterium]
MSVILPKKRATNWMPPLIFLAGPVRGGGDWQYQAYGELEKQLVHFVAAIPMRYEKDYPGHPLLGKQIQGVSNDDPVFARQLAWENYHMLRAARNGCLMFWLAFESEEHPHPGPEPFAMDSRREIGKWTAYLEQDPELRVVVGADPRFYGLDQIQRELNDTLGDGLHFPIHSTLEDTVLAAVARAKSEV